MTNQPARLAWTIAAMLSLSGCTTIEYPNVRKISGDSKDLNELVKNTAIPMREEYVERLQTLTGNLGRTATYNIADGAALAFSAIADANAYFLRFFGFTGGVNLAVDTTFNNNAQAEIYESGLRGLGCMIRTAQGIPVPKPDEQTQTAFSMLSKNEKKLSDKYAAKVKAVVKNFQTTAAAISLADVFATNLMDLDQSVRSKIRKTIKSPTYTGIRDELFKNVAEADKARGQAVEDKVELRILDQDKPEIRELTLHVQNLIQATADMKAFDSDLRKCIATAGL